MRIGRQHYNHVIASKLTPFAAVAALLSLGATPGATTQLPPFPKIASYCARADFRSEGQTIRAALCLPPGATGAVPAVVVLHGCGGFGTLDQVLARDLPLHGIATYYVDYFALTPSPGTRGFCGHHAAIVRAFPTWQRIVLDAAYALARQPGIERRRVGGVGWSLGGALVVVTAEFGGGELGGPAPSPRPFYALVLFSAGGFGVVLEHVRVLPATLVLAGGSEDEPSLKQAIDLYRALRRVGVAAVFHVYPHGGHQWKHEQGIAGERWTVDFLQRYLVR